MKIASFRITGADENGKPIYMIGPVRTIDGSKIFPKLEKQQQKEDGTLDAIRHSARNAPPEFWLRKCIV